MLAFGNRCPALGGTRRLNVAGIFALLAPCMVGALRLRSRQASAPSVRQVILGRITGRQGAHRAALLSPLRVTVVSFVGRSYSTRLGPTEPQSYVSQSVDRIAMRRHSSRVDSGRNTASTVSRDNRHSERREGCQSCGIVAAGPVQNEEGEEVLS
jgi:hypothetical protein